MFASRIARLTPVTTTFVRFNTTVTAALVKELRELTGAPMIECKKALTNCIEDAAVDSDNKATLLSSASEWLRKRGSALAANKSGRNAKEGAVVYAVSQDGRKGALVEVNCETDFVARNNIFLGYATRTAMAALGYTGTNNTVDATNNSEAVDLAVFNDFQLPAGPAAMAINPDASKNSVAQELIDVVTNCRENVKLTRVSQVAVAEGKTGFVAGYIHNELPIPEDLSAYIKELFGLGYQVKFGGAAALVTVMNQDGANAETTQLAKKIAMQTVAARPTYLAKENVPADIIAKEKDIIMSASKTDGKTPEVVEKLIQGKINKFYEEAALIEQQYLITNDSKKQKIFQLLEADASKPEITQFARYTVGENAVINANQE